MLIGKLIWGSNRHRVALAKLFAPLLEGGLGVPNLELYYVAAQLQTAVASQMVGGDTMPRDYTDTEPIGHEARLHMVIGTWCGNTQGDTSNADC